ncbi:SRPBCC domain-containing protein [uncultured Paludibaculum sp.]|uniref:SRPBCC domain-containing protein n=1 Tax=uncultured Paludibaculum sp. TaxID=1765020 RepID=UPI002AAB977F|nr:SRPBCC domain-containing protein [uncultured Paludibaculum sp.]
MPRGFPLFVLAFCLVIFFCWIGLTITHEDRTIDTEITIAAPPEAVWRILTDTGNYAMWNPFILTLSGTLSDGEKLHVTVRPPGDSEMDFVVRIVTITPNRELAWRGGLAVPGIFTGEHRFLLEPIGDGRTKLKQSEHFSGLLVGPLFAGMLDRTEVGFRAMNEALKARCEVRP